MITIIVLIVLFTETTETDCDLITPAKPSDCRLSANDINNGYKYCCYEKWGSEYYCTGYTEESYQYLFDISLVGKCSTPTK